MTNTNKIEAIKWTTNVRENIGAITEARATVPALKTYARTEKIKGFSTLNKSNLIQLIALHESEKQRLHEEKEEFKQLLKQHDNTIYIELVSVSRSGLQRHVTCHLIDNNNTINITNQVAAYSDMTLNDRGIRLNGVGMDMGFHLVYTLSRQLFEGEDADYQLRHRWL